MNKYQTTQFCQSDSSLVAFVVIFILLFDKYKIGFLAGFLFLISLPLLFHMNKLTVPNNFKHNKTLNT